MTPVQRRLVWAAQPILIILTVWLGIGGPRHDVRTPLVFSGDGLVTLAQAKSVMQQGAWWTLPPLARPTGDDTRFSLRDAHIDLVLIRVASLFSRRPSAVVTMAWVFMLVIAGASSAWCLRRLGVSMAGAWSAGALFAMCPYALGHTTANFGAAPYLVPFAATAALQLALAAPADGARSGRRGLLAGTVLLGLNAFPFAVFGAFFVGVGTVAGFVRGRQRALAATGATLFIALALATAANIVWTPADDRSVAAPSAADAEVHGLKLRQLVTPLRDHWIEPLSRWAAREDEARFPNNDVHSRLGLLATVGFLGLIVVLFVPAAASPGPDGETARAASRLTLAAIVLATVGGLGTVFSLLISPALSDYTAITPFLSFFALVAVAVGVDRATGARRRWRAPVWAALVVIGLLDQSVALSPVHADRAPIGEEFTALRTFVSAIEGALPSGSRVLQLPVRPESRLRGPAHMGPYDNFKPWLVSRTLRWSGPELFAENTRWQTDSEAMPRRDQPSHFRDEGFSAIVVDRFGFRDAGASLLDELQAAPQPIRLILQDGRYVAFDIREP